MADPLVTTGGGWAAIRYLLRKGREAGGLLPLYRRLRSRNACKTCALGMGGQRGGMVNEAGHFPEVCKKSIQAQTGDMAGAITESFLQDHSLARLEQMSSYELERLGRLTFPILAEAGDTHYRRIDWDDALQRVSSSLNGAEPDHTFWYASGRASNEAAFLLQLVARAYGTNNINNCSFYCHSASGAALSRIYGSGTASVVLDDLRQADLALVAGANPASNHPRLISQLVNLRRRGGRVIVINPLRELGLMRFRIPSDWRSMLAGSQVSDLYLQPHIGGDLPLFVALLKGLIERDALDRTFIDLSTAGWELVLQDVQDASWAELISASGVPREQIDEAVELIGRAHSGIVLWAMGLTQHANGTDTITALANVALARGWLGRPGAGLLPIRGHSNVQGIHSVGVYPALKQAFRDQLEEVYDVRVSAEPGQDTYASMLAAEAGQVEAAVLLGGNLFGSNPDRLWAARAMQRIGTTTYVTTKLNEGHVHGRGRTCLILPVLARDEEAQATSQESMFNFVRLSDGGTPSVKGEMRSEVDVIAALAQRILPAGRFNWSELRSHEHLREVMARTVPGYGGMSELNRSRTEFQIEGRTFHECRFNTPDGKAHFHVTPRTDWSPDAETFRLMTLRSEGQFNTVVYEEEDLYRGNLRRDVVMMSAEDAAALGSAEGDRVIVETSAGHMAVSVAIVDIRPGNLAMYFPEANVLVPRNIDPKSGTPAFKSVAARVRTLEAAVAEPAPVPA